MPKKPTKTVRAWVVLDCHWKPFDVKGSRKDANRCNNFYLHDSGHVVRMTGEVPVKKARA